ncbi:MAG: flagellar basal body rod protein FlgC [Lachnospiraceae bacterium]|jgi:flagellar basal-body rod protein FlgC|nr:flagellar basal body rod protein FlgC [Lachnospiraceae bacterium]MEE3460459.1 flagellar basal body rod protein FlgC [Lachnospiraceae bacterium]
MGVFSGMDISTTGMTAERTRLDIIAQNIANVNTTRDADGGVYRRKSVIFQEKAYPSFDETLATATNGMVGGGVKVSRIFEDNKSEVRMVYDPSNPDADEKGYVTYPNVNTVQEMTDMIDATRAYEANVTAFDASKNMQLRALQIGQS